MTKTCDHKSVGMLVSREDALLLIERKKPPFGFAPPAGHVDQDGSFEESAKRELKEEVGLETQSLKLLIEGRKENPCGREGGGSWHYWKIYKVEAVGDIKGSEDETKQTIFCDKDDMLLLASKTEKYLRGDIDQHDWEGAPGLEPIWYEWLKELNML